LIPSSDSDHTIHLIAGTAAAIGTGAVATWLLRRQQQRSPVANPFSDEHITSTFVAALPTITRQLNLEVATTHQVEVFERTDAKVLLWGWIDLGTNVAVLRVPVTYRYHIRLYDRWKLRVIGNRLMVESPLIRASMPPAIHTDEMVSHAVRGWARGSASELVTQLQREMTPTLRRYAGDPKRIDLIRETCRQSAAEFVRGWLDSQGQWRADRFTNIEVRFADEPELPLAPTLKLLS
jgi:hypothetical protein